MPKVRMAGVWEIDGRLLIRTVNSCGGAGIEDQHTAVLEPFPDLGLDEIGQAVQAALAGCRDVPWPSSWPAMRDYARPFLELSPRRYRSYRSWQRAARHVGVVAAADAVRVERWHPDLGRGSWEPSAAAADDEFTYQVVLTAEAEPTAMGAAVVTVLQAPPLRGASASP